VAVNLPKKTERNKTMKVLAINGSPRKKWNTATLLQNSLDDAVSQGGAETELIRLYDLTYTDCTSCLGRKLNDGKSYGKYAMQDGLTPVLEMIRDVNALILGSPIYLGTLTGMMHSFMEQLMFPYLTYTRPPASIFHKKILTASIYTMNVSEQQMKGIYATHIWANENVLKMMFSMLKPSPPMRYSSSRITTGSYSAISTRRRGRSDAG
jgi:multimeric flavodoxin WrbA